METQELELVQQVSPEVVYQQDKAAIDVQISTAKAYPRTVRRSLENALAIVTIDSTTAQSCTYSVPRGGKSITGPSVHLAKILAQCWGNLRIEAKVISVEATQVTSEAVCFDLENNIAIKTQVKRSIMGKHGRFSEDMVTVTGNAANSIALRNAILSVIPRGVVDKVYNAAKECITGDVSDKNKLLVKRKQVFEGLRDAYEISDKEILYAIGRAAVDFVTGDDLVVLIGIGQAIKDGDTTVEQAFKGQKTNGTAPVPTVEELQQLLEAKVEFLNKAEFDYAKRIIEKKEKDSYQKLFDQLTSKTA